MSTIDSLALSGPHAAGLETGAQLAERLSARTATGCGPLHVPPALVSLFPSRGLERGSVYRITGDAALSLFSTLVSVATHSGSWLSLVNLEHVGFLALHEHGVALHRTVNVSVQHDHSSWAGVVGALVDGFDLIATSSPQCSPAEARRISARVKAQSSILFLLGSPGAFSPDAVVSASTQQWMFSTHATHRSVRVEAQGRRVHGNRSCVVHLPNEHGALSAVPSPS